MQWKSYHIFINNYDVIDEFIKKDLKKIVEYLKNNKIKKWFFIRYWHGGPHIRLRYLSEMGKDLDLKGVIEPILDKYKDCKFITSESINDDKLAQFERLDNIKWYKNLLIEPIEYMPENKRYGGVNVMSLSEDIFMESSEFTLNLIERSSFNQRIIIAFDIMFLTFKTIFGVDFDKYIKQYQLYWERYSKKEVYEAYETVYYEILKDRFLDLNLNINKYKKLYAKYIDSVNEKYSQIKKEQITYKEGNEHGILFSHIHMNNNRLGTFPEIEYFLSLIIIKLGSELNDQMVER